MATWGVVQHHELLVGKGTDSTNPLYFCGNGGHATKGLVEIEPNHTHMLLVDDGSTGEFGREIQLRSDIEDQLCDRSRRCSRDLTVDLGNGGGSEGAGEGRSAEARREALREGTESSGRLLRGETGTAVMVQLLVGGGPNSIKTVKQTLEKQRPVVVFSDTGRSAGVIRAAYDFAAQHPEVDMLGGSGDLPSADELGLKAKEDAMMWDKLQAEVRQRRARGRLVSPPRGRSA